MNQKWHPEANQRYLGYHFFWLGIIECWVEVGWNCFGKYTKFVMFGLLYHLIGEDSSY